MKMEAVMIARVSIASACVFTTAMTFAQTPAGMSNEQRVATWKGEKIMLLGRPFDAENYHPYLKPRGKQRSLKYRDYVGKTGVVTEATANFPHLSMVLRLDDSGEELEVSSGAEGSVFFLAEMVAARKLVEQLKGKPLWAKAKVALYGPETEESRRLNISTAFELGQLSKLTLESVELARDSYQPIKMYFRTEDGKEGALIMGGQSGDCLEPRFHLSWYSGACKTAWSVDDAFYVQAPQTLFPGWSEAVWKLIRKGEVAIGMTEPMAKVACGGRLQEAGGVLSEDGRLAPIYDCYGKRFLVEKGKVSKYMQ